MRDPDPALDPATAELLEGAHESLALAYTELDQVVALLRRNGNGDLVGNHRPLKRRGALRMILSRRRLRRLAPHGRRACNMGRRRPGHRSNPACANAPPAGEDPEPEPPALPLLRRSERLQIESLSRLEGVVA